MRIQQSTSARNNVGLLCNIDQFTNMCKELLCLHSLYKNYNQDCYITKSQFIDTLDGLVRNILHKVATNLQQLEHSMGWKLQRFHDITYMPSDIYKFGSPSNYDTGQGERGLKSWAKYPAKTAQMQGSKIFQNSSGPLVT